MERGKIKVPYEYVLARLLRPYLLKMILPQDRSIYNNAQRKRQEGAMHEVRYVRWPTPSDQGTHPHP